MCAATLRVYQDLLGSGAIAPSSAK
jgi:hypothetical protein